MHRNNDNIVKKYNRYLFSVANLFLPLSAINSIVSEIRVENWEQKYLNSPIYDTDRD